MCFFSAFYWNELPSRQTNECDKSSLQLLNFWRPINCHCLKIYISLIFCNALHINFIFFNTFVTKLIVILKHNLFRSIISPRLNSVALKFKHNTHIIWILDESRFKWSTSVWYSNTGHSGPIFEWVLEIWTETEVISH